MNEIIDTIGINNCEKVNKAPWSLEVLCNRQDSRFRTLRARGTKVIATAIKANLETIRPCCDRLPFIYLSFMFIFPEKHQLYEQ